MSPPSTTTNPATMVTTTKVTKVPGADSAWRNLFDAIADMHFGQVHALVNADFGIDKAPGAPKQQLLVRRQPDSGIRLERSVRRRFARGVPGRPRRLSRPGLRRARRCEGVDFDATLTLAATPTPHLIIKLEPRLDAVSSDEAGFGVTSGFPKGAPAAGQPQDYAKTQFTATLGVVATTN